MSTEKIYEAVLRAVEACPERDRFKSHLDIGAEQRRHPADTDWNSLLHRLAANFEQACRISQTKCPGRRKRRVFTEGMAGNESTAFGQVDTAFRFKNPQNCHAQRHQRRLRIFRQLQFFGRPLGHQFRQILAKRVVNFLEGFPCD